MRPLFLILLLLIALIQYPLWLGKGGWLQVRALEKEIAQKSAANLKLQQRNASLDADVRDLKQGYAAIEERARSHLGMIREDEVFFQVIDAGKAPKAPPKSP